MITKTFPRKFSMFSSSPRRQCEIVILFFRLFLSVFVLVLVLILNDVICYFIYISM